MKKELRKTDSELAENQVLKNELKQNYKLKKNNILCRINIQTLLKYQG